MARKPVPAARMAKMRRDGRGGFLVDDKVVLILRVALVAVAGVGSHELAAFRAGRLTALTFLEVSRL